jgi:peroxin-5
MILTEDTAKENPFASHPSPLSLAKDLLASNGSLTEAALLLESAIQQGDLGNGGYEAWILLGETWSMDEREANAIRALREGVKIAEGVKGSEGEGMVSLAVAYTNEGYEKASYIMLLHWLRTKFYPSHLYTNLISPLSSKEDLDKLATWVLKERATEGYLNLAREQHGRGVVDPDVQIGLGVLLYTSGDYERAKDCFEAALLVRPNVSQPLAVVRKMIGANTR